MPKPKPSTYTPLTRSRRQQILTAVRKGDSYRVVGARFDISAEWVRRIVTDLDPALISRRRKQRAARIPPEPPKRYCAIHPDRLLPTGRRRYCGPSCADAVRVLKELSIYRLGHLHTMARRDGRVGIKPATLKVQVLSKKSKAYRTLKKHNLLDQLPKRVEIR